VSAVAFGDSLTYGIGDGHEPGEFLESLPEQNTSGGYPRRVKALLGIPVTNAGVPGEELVATGVFRIPAVAAANSADYALLLEGSNDAVKQVSSGDYARAYQRSINVMRASGRTVVAMTPPPPTGVHAALAPFTAAYATAVRDLANVNDLALVDLERVWTTVCPALEQCPLYNIPEGLHPNSRGYDAIAQAVSAALLEIDIFSPEGAASLESALGLPAGTVIIRPR